MNELIHRALEATHKYTLGDYAFLKITLISLGILLGSYFAEFFINHTTVLWIIFLISYLFIIFRTFITHKF